MWGGNVLKDNRIGWDEFFLYFCRLLSKRATCMSKQIGCVITKDRRIIASGYNGSIPGFPHCNETGCYKSLQGFSTGDFNCCRSIHAEVNALTHAAKQGISVEGAVLYCTYLPCWSCYKQIKASGIIKIIAEFDYPTDNFEYESLKKAELENGNMILVGKLKGLVI